MPGEAKTGDQGVEWRILQAESWTALSGLHSPGWGAWARLAGRAGWEPGSASSSDSPLALLPAAQRLVLPALVFRDSNRSRCVGKCSECHCDGDNLTTPGSSLFGTTHVSFTGT